MDFLWQPNSTSNPADAATAVNGPHAFDSHSYYKQVQLPYPCVDCSQTDPSFAVALAYVDTNKMLFGFSRDFSDRVSIPIRMLICELFAVRPTLFSFIA